MKRILICILVVVLLLTTTGCSNKKTASQSSISSTESKPKVSSQTVSSETSEPQSSITKPTSSVAKPVTPTVTTPQPQPSVTPPTISATGYKYNTNLDIADNLFVDSLVYTGYNLAKHTADGNRWVYILASQKRGMGYLSNIGYGGGSSGYETNADGKPDIAAFERKGLVCASFATYVYFNYLPNVAGIDTSSLTRPEKSYSANDWYIAAKDWVAKGYSEYIPFTATHGYANFINFKSEKEIPIGSILVCYDVKKSNTYGSHVAIYTGYKNGNHWVVHVGNDNGPEFCSIERMNCGPDPHWPLAIISTPSNIRFSASAEIEVLDNENTPVKNINLQLKNKATGFVTDVVINSEGKANLDKLSYGEYEVIYPTLDGYTTDNALKTVTLNTQDNSLNKISLLINKKVEHQPESSNSNTTS